MPVAVYSRTALDAFVDSPLAWRAGWPRYIQGARPDCLWVETRGSASYEELIDLAPTVINAPVALSGHAGRDDVTLYSLWTGEQFGAWVEFVTAPGVLNGDIGPDDPHGCGMGMGILTQGLGVLRRDQDQLDRLTEVLRSRRICGEVSIGLTTRGRITRCWVEHRLPLLAAYLAIVRMTLREVAEACSERKPVVAIDPPNVVLILRAGRLGGEPMHIPSPLRAHCWLAAPHYGYVVATGDDLKSARANLRRCMDGLVDAMPDIAYRSDAGAKLLFAINSDLLGSPTLQRNFSETHIDIAVPPDTLDD